MSGKSIISNSYLEDIGDAIRYKKGTEETFYPSQMGDAIRSIEGIVPSGTMEIDANGVYDVTEKASVDVDVQPDLRPLSVSENGSYEPDGFDGYSEVTVNNPAQWTTNGVASGEEPSGEIYINDVTFIASAFAYNKAITKARGKNLVGAHSIFQNCPALTECNLHFTALGYSNNIFVNCSNLKIAVIKCDGTNGTQGLFGTCSELDIADLEMANIRQSTFNNCYKLQTLIIRNIGQVIRLDNVSAFNNTPLRGYDGLSGTIYVPQALLESYKTANNWKTVFEEGHMTFLPLEESEWASKYADGTPVS